MVRVLHPFSSPIPAEWWVDTGGGFPVMEKVQVSEHAGLNEVKNETFIRCLMNNQMHPGSGIFYGENPLQFSFTLLLLQISLVIFITRIVRFLLKPLKQPRVVSEIIGGIFVGPSVLGQSKKFSANIFPDQSSFVVKNIGVMGFMFYLFVTGVKMDIGIIRKSGRKQWVIAFCGVFIPFAIGSVVPLLFHKSLDKEIQKFTSFGWIASGIAITAFPVLYPIVKELNLLSSEVGRQALATAIISDVIGINAIISFEAAQQGIVESQFALYYMIALIVLLILVIGGIMPAMHWIVQRTPEGKAVEQMYVTGILLGVFFMGFLTDMFGVAIANGPLWLGLAIPDGPPLGATLVEKSESFVMEILMPVAFTMIGLHIDVYSMSGLGSTLWPMFWVVLSGFFSKLVVTHLAALYFGMPFRDSLTLSLILGLRGQVELLLAMHWLERGILNTPLFTLLVIMATAWTAISTPLISILYDPTRPYMINKKRTIQHTPTNSELHIVACIQDQESVAGIINLLEISNPTANCPFIVYALYLVELVGRAAPVFIDHQKQERGRPTDYTNYNNLDTIHNALKMYEERRQDIVNIHLFTAVSPKRSMYQDICELALVKKASLIILLFQKEYGLDSHGGIELVRHRMHSVNVNVLSHAPCSVGILVEKRPSTNPPNVIHSMRRSTHHFAVLFLGGADAREALAYADRMANDSGVCLSVIRFLSKNGVGDNEMEKKLDDGIVTWFWVKNEANQRVAYREAVVKNGEETIATIRAMNDESYGLWILGRKQGINPVLLQGLTDCCENQELGVIGDYLASIDFESSASILVIRQQVLRGQASAMAKVRAYDSLSGWIS